MNEFNTVEEIEKKYNIFFNDDYIELKQYILDIFNGKNNFKNVNSLYLHINGLYYQYIIGNYEIMKNYYLKAIELNNSFSMCNLGNYYRTINDYDKMKKYYLMAINLNNDFAMANLGSYYATNEIDYDLMGKYYLMAISNNNSIIAKNQTIINNLGYYYQYIEKNYDEMKKYHLIAINMNNSYAMYSLGVYYECIEKNDDEMKKYYLMAINLNNIDALNKLKKHYNKLKLYVIFKNIDNPSELIKSSIKILLNDTSVNNYNNKINYYKKHNNIIECSICYETKLNIPFECMHFCCVDCYVRINKCYLCNT